MKWFFIVILGVLRIEDEATKSKNGDECNEEMSTEGNCSAEGVEMRSI